MMLACLVQRVRRRSLQMFRAAALVASFISLVAFATTSQSAGRTTSEKQADTPRVEQTTLTGCLQADPKGKGFVLTDVRPSKAGTAGSPLTSAGAGTSATGEAPSGSVTGKTPTGSTATTTSAETPAAGAAGATANPASPTFNQGDPTAGTTGTVPRPDDASATPVRKYQLMAATGVDLATHAGHTVEIRGTLKPSAGTPPAEPAPREGGGSATAEPTSEMRTPVIEVQAVTHVAAGCQK
jgi:hypothetical protein